jgi:hypothetical protein
LANRTFWKYSRAGYIYKWSRFTKIEFRKFQYSFFIIYGLYKMNIFSVKRKKQKSFVKTFGEIPT